MVRSILKACLAVILAAALLCGLIPVVSVAASAAVLQIGVLSDTHFFGKEQADGYCEAFMQELTGQGKMFLETEALLESALAGLAAHAKQNGMKYVFISGDLTKDGELEGHQAFAKRLERFEKETGLQVAVIPGNHDINNAMAVAYVNGKSQPGNKTSPEQFREIYDRLGFDLPNAAFFTPKAGNKGGMLSYAADLGDDFRLVALDTNKYSADQSSKGIDEHESGGMVSDELLAWAAQQCRAAVKAGKTVIAMGHHNLTKHVGMEDRYFSDFVLDDFVRVRETLAEAGMHFYFSGHIHQGEIGDCVADNGEVLFDICTSALSGYPAQFREVKFTAKSKNDVTAAVQSYEADCVKPVEVLGKVYASPFSKTAFGLTFHADGIDAYVNGAINGMIGGIFEDIKEAGGLLNYIGSTGLDLEGTLGGLIEGKVQLGSRDIITGANIMGLLGDIFAQVDKSYINQSDRTLQLLVDAIDQLLTMQVSALPSTRFLKEFGFGDASRPGTFADLGNEILLYTYGRYDDAEDNAFLMDAIEKFESGENTQVLVDLLLRVLVDELIQDEILKTLHLSVSPAFAKPFLRLTVGAMLDGLLNLILLGDTSFSAIVDLVFAIIDRFELLPYDSLDSVIDGLLEDYWTDSMNEGISFQLARVARELVIDLNDIPDINATLRYTGPRKVIPTSADLRLPSLLVQTLPSQGEDFDRVISWYTKESVTGSDLRIWNSAGKDVTKELDITKKTEKVDRVYPGVDLGLASLLDVDAHLLRHTITIRGLQPKQGYTYQVGDAAKNWWSPKGRIRFSGGGNWVQDTTFLSFSDAQSQTPHQYERAWGAVTAKALEKYPDASFALSAGDHVDSGKNFDQWQWFFDKAQPSLLQLPLMPTAGNHDKDDAILNYFPVEKTYYSFDYNNIHVAVLDTNDLDGDNKLSADQVEWLKADMAASDADWKIVVEHKSLYSNGSHYKDSDVVALRAQLPPIFSALGIDLVFAGHDHTYLRTTVDGVKYIIAGTSGVRYYNVKDASLTDEYFPRGEAYADSNGPMFSACSIEGETLRYEAWRLEEDGSLALADSFDLTKELAAHAAPAGWDEIIEDYSFSLPNDAGSPNTGVNGALSLIPFCLLLAAGFMLLLLRRREQTAA